MIISTLSIRRPRQSDAGVYTCEASNEMGQVFAVLDLQDSVALPHIEEEEEVMMMDSTHTSHHASAAASPGPAMATLLLVLATQRLVPSIHIYISSIQYLQYIQCLQYLQYLQYLRTG